MTNETKVNFVCPTAPEFTFQSKEGEVKASRGVLSVSPSVAQEIDDLIATGKRPDLAQNLRRVDENAAKAIVAAHRAKMTPMAGRGVESHHKSPLHIAQQTDHEHRAQNATNPDANLPVNQELSPSATVPPTLAAIQSHTGGPIEGEAHVEKEGAGTVKSAPNTAPLFGGKPAPDPALNNNVNNDQKAALPDAGNLQDANKPANPINNLFQTKTQ